MLHKLGSQVGNLTSYSISRSRSLHVIRLELNTTKLNNLTEDDKFLQGLVQCNGGQLKEKLLHIEKKKTVFPFFAVLRRVYFHQKLNQNQVNGKTFSSFFLPRETLTKRSCPKTSLDPQKPLGRLPSTPPPSLTCHNS